MPHDSAALARQWFERVWGEGDARAIDELSSASVVAHQPDGSARSMADWKEFHRQILGAMGQRRVIVEEAVGQGDTGVVRWRFTGVHTGTLLGIPATGRPLDIRGMTWSRYRDGKIVESWDGWDAGGRGEHAGGDGVALRRVVRRGRWPGGFPIGKPAASPTARGRDHSRRGRNRGTRGAGWWEPSRRPTTSGTSSYIRRRLTKR